MTCSSSKSFLFYTSLTKKSLYNYKNYIATILKKFNIKFNIVCFSLKKKQRKHTLLKSPHITKKAKESFELTLFRFVVVIPFNNHLLKILRSNVPNTMHLKCIVTS